MTLVDLVKALNTLRTDTILQLIREVVKKPHQIKGDQVLHTHIYLNVEIPYKYLLFIYTASILTLRKKKKLQFKKIFVHKLMFKCKIT